MSKKEEQNLQLAICEGKDKHKSEKEANIQIKIIGRRGIVPYVCPFCAAYHVGHSQEKPRRKTRPRKKIKRPFLNKRIAKEKNKHMESHANLIAVNNILKSSAQLAEKTTKQVSIDVLRSIAQSVVNDNSGSNIIEKISIRVSKRRVVLSQHPNTFYEFTYRKARDKQRKDGSKPAIGELKVFCNEVQKDD